MMKLGKFFVLLFLLLQSYQLYAYIIKGVVVDEKGNPIRKAVVIGRNTIQQVVVGVETDQQGAFTTAEVKDSILSVEISKDGYTMIKINVSGTSGEVVNLGLIKLQTRVLNLGEVVVTAQSVIQKIDRYIVIPSRKELDQAANGLSLLSDMQYKMPGLSVNESLQTIKVDNATPILKINGKPTALSNILTLNPHRILRIEYHENPDVRYENRRVINIILNPRGDGGTFITNLSTGINASFLNSSIGGGYYQKKSEWEFSYSTNWRNYDQRELNSTSSFIGRKSPVLRTRDGIPSDFRYWGNTLSLGYTYRYNSNTIFAMKVGLGLENQKMDEDTWNTQLYMGSLSNYQNLLYKQLKYNSPNIDLFFRKEIDKTQYVEANIYGRYSNGDYHRRHMNLYQNPGLNDSVLSLTTDLSWRIGADLMYSKTFKRIVTTLGIQNFYNKTDNVQTENGIIGKSSLSQNRLSIYGQLQGRIKQLNYSFNAIGIYNHANNHLYKTDAVRMKANIVANYSLSKQFTLNYLLMLEPTLPSVSQQSTLVQRIDEMTFRQGNPNLKTSSYVRNRLYIRYADKRFTASLWASHSRTQAPIYYDYSYIDNVSSPYYDMFMSRPINGVHNDQFNLELNVAAQELWGIATIWGNIGWNHFCINVNEKSFVKKRLYAAINGAFVFGNWLINAKFQIQPNYQLRGNMYSTDERWNTIKVQYKHNDWHFSLTGVNMFTKRGGFYDNIVFSEVHPENYTLSIRDNANMIMLGVSRKFDFGKKRTNTKRSLNNDGIEKGVDITW